MLHDSNMLYNNLSLVVQHLSFINSRGFIIEKPPCRAKTVTNQHLWLISVHLLLCPFLRTEIILICT
jgi:hypothetical protein